MCSLYEINVIYLDVLSVKKDEDILCIVCFILVYVVLLSFLGVFVIYIQSIIGFCNDYEGVEWLGYNRVIN